MSKKDDSWCIENDFAAQKEFVEMRESVIIRLREDLLSQRVNNANLILALDEYKAAMKWWFGDIACDKALTLYRENIVKKQQ